jgi:hypothetical protein
MPAQNAVQLRRRMLLTAAGLVVALLAMAAFAASYIGAFHDPTPHHVPIGVIDARSAAASTRRTEPSAPTASRRSWRSSTT